MLSIMLGASSTVDFTFHIVLLSPSLPPSLLAYLPTYLASALVYFDTGHSGRMPNASVSMLISR
jgi:hypothetical protein